MKDKIEKLKKLSDSELNRVIATLKEFPPQEPNMIWNFTDPNELSGLGQTRMGRQVQFGWKDVNYPSWAMHTESALELLSDLIGTTRNRAICIAWLLLYHQLIEEGRDE